MPENLYCIGQSKITPQYEDGYYRTFRTPPKMGGPVKKMLMEYVENDQYQEIIVFFIGFCDASYDYACYLMRELVNGDL